MSDPIRPERLIVQAKALAGWSAGRGRPSPTDHRRAVSAAYYALFHSIVAEAVQRVLPPPIANERERHLAARWIDHADVKQAAEWVVSCAAESQPTTSPARRTGERHGIWQLFSKPRPRGMRVSAVPLALTYVARAFVTLQDARHRADYDHLASFPKAAAVRYVRIADRALQALRDNVDDRYVQRFLALVVFRGRRLQ